MNFEERAVSFPCHDCWLYGILSVPEQVGSRGVLIVVGGPQYRVGSHRQFTLLARYLAAHGVPVMRFDYRGMGDSEGRQRNFQDIDDDVRAAIDQFFDETPALEELVIWGLCDAASAALFYAYQDKRVTGLVLLNPWVRTKEGIAKAYLKHYYFSRLFEPELWRKICSGKFHYAAAGRSFSTLITDAFVRRKTDISVVPEAGLALQDRMFDGLNRFKGRVLLIISGNDLTAKEFADLVSGSGKWQKLLQSARIERRDLSDANHTFSRRDWRNQAAIWTKEWIQKW
jgi:exosortase A-associated hydrolase 1